MNKSEKDQKAYTQKSAQAELSRLDKGIAKKSETIRQLKEEIRSDKKKYKELLAIFYNLCQEDLQQQIMDAWFKEQKLTPEQVQKFLDLSKQLNGKIDQLDVHAIVQAVEASCAERVANESRQIDLTDESKR